MTAPKLKNVHAYGTEPAGKAARRLIFITPVIIPETQNPVTTEPIYLGGMIAANPSTLADSTDVLPPSKIISPPTI